MKPTNPTVCVLSLQIPSDLGHPYELMASKHSTIDSVAQVLPLQGCSFLGWVNLSYVSSGLPLFLALLSFPVILVFS